MGMHPNCRDNSLCASLDSASRAKLCAACTRRLVKAGSIQFYNDFETSAVLVLDGAIMFSAHTGEDVLGLSEELPSFYVGMSGCLLGSNATFTPDVHHDYEGNTIEYLSDSCIASIRHYAVRELFRHDEGFAASIARSLVDIMEQACCMSALLRARSVYLAVSYLVTYLTASRIYLTQQQLADIIARDRASVSKAIGRIRRERPDMWAAYECNRGRIVELWQPA